jgi:threonine dehydrogenase-like Zn-dependent dehydrogenase
MSTHVLFVEKLDTIAGKRVGVFGLGPAGLISVQLLQAAGAERIIGFDPLPSRRDMAVQMGADLALDPSQPEARDFPKRWQPGCLDYAFDCSGAVSAVHRAMEVTNHIVVLFAVQREPYVFAPQYWMGLTLVGTQPYTREAAEYAAARLADGRLDLGSLVTHTMKLEEYDRAIDLLKRREAIKVAFLPQAS